MLDLNSVAKPSANQINTRAGHYKDLTETGNRARKVSGSQGTVSLTRRNFGPESAIIKKRLITGQRITLKNTSPQ